MFFDRLQAAHTHSAVPFMGRPALFRSWCETICGSRQNGQVASAKKSGTWVTLGVTGLQTILAPPGWLSKPSAIERIRLWPDLAMSLNTSTLADLWRMCVSAAASPPRRLAVSPPPASFT